MSSDLLSSLLSNVWAIFLVVAFFGGSIFVHELGHFLVARRRGVHVERFSIGFGPAIFKWWGKDGVEYRLSWIPLGGYVLLPQLADLGPIEGEVATDVSKLPPPSYATKVLVFVAGATFNVVFAFALACVLWVVGQPIPAQLTTTQIGHLDATVKLADGKTVPNPAIEAGLEAGDVVVSVDGRRVADFDDIAAAIYFGKQRSDDGRRKATLGIERGGQKLERVVYPVIAGEEKTRTAGIEPIEDLTVEEVFKDTPAAAAGVKTGDRIVAVNGQPVFRRNTIGEYLAAHPDQPLRFTFARGDQKVDLTMQPRLEQDKISKKMVARVGIKYREIFIVVRTDPFTQIKRVVTRTFQILDGLISRNSDVRPDQLSSAGGIAHEMYRQAQWDIRGLLGFTLLLNISLAIFNLLPIPILDGGQIVFATIARLRGRPLPVNFIVATQSVFMVLFLAMFAYITVKGDIRRILRDNRERAEAAAPARVAPVQPAK